ncbi:hypothetical protein ACG2LH_14455 [Zhouia sp. PK063]|uniref:hypothetical protein n=1 Tax=Zhouia sp. PK063 TaxID=3373602 RepID=UPI0037A13174
MKCIEVAVMSDMTEIVTALEQKVNKLLKRLEAEKQANIKLKAALEISEKSTKNLEIKVSDWEEKYETLKLANSMLGSNENKTEAKLKINTLIREIDACIAHLSE